MTVSGRPEERKSFNIPFWDMLIFLLQRNGLKPIHSQDHRRLCVLLRKLREEKELTQAMLAAKLTVPQSFVSKIETGERRLDILELRELCAALDIPLRKFIQRLEEELE